MAEIYVVQFVAWSNTRLCWCNRLNRDIEENKQKELNTLSGNYFHHTDKIIVFDSRKSHECFQTIINQKLWGMQILKVCISGTVLNEREESINRVFAPFPLNNIKYPGSSCQFWTEPVKILRSRDASRTLRPWLYFIQRLAPCHLLLAFTTQVSVMCRSL